MTRRIWLGIYVFVIFHVFTYRSAVNKDYKLENATKKMIFDTFQIAI